MTTINRSNGKSNRVSPKGVVRLVVEVGKDASTGARRFARWEVPYAIAKQVVAFVEGLAEDSQFFAKFDTEWKLREPDAEYEKLNANLVTLAKARLRGAGYTLSL